MRGFQDSQNTVDSLYPVPGQSSESNSRGAKSQKDSSGAQTVARKFLWSGPRSNFRWKENLTL